MSSALCTIASMAGRIVVLAVLVPVSLYLCVRLSALAWFNARKEYDRWKIRGER